MGVERLGPSSQDATQGKERPPKEGRGEEAEEKEGPKCAKATHECLLPLYERHQTHGEEREPGRKHRRGGQDPARCGARSTPPTRPSLIRRRRQQRRSGRWRRRRTPRRASPRRRLRKAVTRMKRRRRRRRRTASEKQFRANVVNATNKPA